VGLVTPFYERPHEERMAALHALDAIGPCSFSYTGVGITITVPRTSTSAVVRWATLHRLVARDWFYFPLCADQVPEIMRHDGRYPGSRGFHLFVHCVPMPEGGHCDATAP
jgi:hypothetical protein